MAHMHLMFTVFIAFAIISSNGAPVKTLYASLRKSPVVHSGQVSTNGLPIGATVGLKENVVHVDDRREIDEGDEDYEDESENRGTITAYSAAGDAIKDNDSIFYPGDEEEEESTDLHGTARSYGGVDLTTDKTPSDSAYDEYNSDSEIGNVPNDDGEEYLPKEGPEGLFNSDGADFSGLNTGDRFSTSGQGSLKRVGETPVNLVSVRQVDDDEGDDDQGPDILGAQIDEENFELGDGEDIEKNDDNIIDGDETKTDENPEPLANA